MGLIADIMLVAGALGATFYCYILSRRLAKFNNLEKGVGGAVAVLSAQVDDMTKALVKAESAAKSSTISLNDLTGRAEGVARRLELLVASMHDLPEPEVVEPQKAAFRSESAAPPASPSSPNPVTATKMPDTAPETDRPKTPSASEEAEAAQDVLFLRHRVPQSGAGQ